MRRADVGISRHSVSKKRWSVRKTARSGFTLLEIVVVLVMTSVVMALIMPTVHGFYSVATSGSARDRVQSYLGAARAVAVQTGRASVFHSSSGSIWVTADSNGAQVVFRPTIRLDSAYKVSLTANSDSVVFDGRGIAQNLSGFDLISVSKDGVAYTLCVSALGAILKAPTCS